MADFLHRLAERTLNPSAVVQPLIKHFSAPETGVPESVPLTAQEEIRYDHKVTQVPDEQKFSPAQMGNTLLSSDAFKPEEPDLTVPSDSSRMQQQTKPSFFSRIVSPIRTIFKPRLNHSKGISEQSSAESLFGAKNLSANNRIKKTLIEEPTKKNFTVPLDSKQKWGKASAAIHDNETFASEGARAGFEEFQDFAAMLPAPLVQPDGTDSFNGRVDLPPMTTKKISIETAPPGPRTSSRQAVPRIVDTESRELPKIGPMTKFENKSLKPEESPTIRVTIGRVDVRAVFPTEPSKPRGSSQRSPGLSLEEYLKARNGGSQ